MDFVGGSLTIPWMALDCHLDLKPSWTISTAGSCRIACVLEILDRWLDVSTSLLPIVWYKCHKHLPGNPGLASDVPILGSHIREMMIFDDIKGISHLTQPYFRMCTVNHVNPRVWWQETWGESPNQHPIFGRTVRWAQLTRDQRVAKACDSTTSRVNYVFSMVIWWFHQEKWWWFNPF